MLGNHFAQVLILSIIALIQGVVISVAPKYFDYRIRKGRTHNVEKAFNVFEKLKMRITKLRELLDADRIYIVYYSNGEQYYTGEPAQFCTLLAETLNPSKPKLKSAVGYLTKVPISYFYRNLHKLFNNEYFLSPNNNTEHDTETSLNQTFSTVSLNGFRININKRRRPWQIWTPKAPFWVGTLYIAYDREVEITAGQVLLIQTQLREMAIEIENGNKNIE